MKYIFDTSFIVSLLNIDDINHNRAVENLQLLEKDNFSCEFFINQLILTETYTVLNNKKGFESIEKLELFLTKFKVIFIESKNSDYIELFKMLRGKVSVPDCSVLYDSWKIGLTILSFDKKMLQIDKNF